jgi:sugar lactone lactonase YvrE
MQQTSIFTVPILADGSAGEIAPYVVTENQFINSGIALDAEGRVYVTDVIQNGVIRVDPDGTSETLAAGTDAGFDGLNNIAFGVGGTELTMYAVNVPYGTFEASDTPGPTLVAIDVDTPGMPRP